MPNRIWQAEEEKWEKKRQRAEKALAHIRELRRLEDEEEAEEQRAVAEPQSKSAGQPANPAGQTPQAAERPPAPVPPLSHATESQPVAQDQPTTAKKPAKELIPELLLGGPMTMKAMAEALGRSQQAIANALKELQQAKVVTEEPSTFPGFRHQYRLATKEEDRLVPIKATQFAEEEHPFD